MSGPGRVAPSIAMNCHRPMITRSVMTSLGGGAISVRLPSNIIQTLAGFFYVNAGGPTVMGTLYDVLELPM
jgi:hypothetical protein